MRFRRCVSRSSPDSPTTRSARKWWLASCPTEGDVIDIDALRARCREVLSPYKVPTLIEVLAPESIPQLSSGKPDRRAVAALLAQRRTESAR